MKKMKKIFSLLICFSMLVGVSACSKGGSSTKTKSGGPLVITCMRVIYEAQPPQTNSPLQKAFEEKLNVKFESQYVPSGTYSEVFNTTMATNKVPMLIEIPSSLAANPGFIKYCNAGVFWDLTDKLSSSSAFMKEGLVSENCLKTGSVGGRYYLLSGPAPSARVAVVYRKDWADKVGAPVPNTIDNFYKMAQMFTENDPDRDGKKDTYGFSYIDDGQKETAYAGTDTLTAGYGGPNVWGKKSDETYYPYFESDGYMKMMNLLKDMYAKGYMNNDFYVIKGNDKYSGMLSGKAGMMMTSATNSCYPGGKFDPLLAGNPNAKIAYVQTFQLNGKPVTNSIISVGSVGGTVFSKSSCSKDQLNQILNMFIKARTTPEIDKLLTLGVKDLHYTQNADGTVSISDEQIAKRKSDGSGDSGFSPVPIPGRVLDKDYGQPMTASVKITKDELSKEQYAVNDASAGLMDSDMLSTLTSQSTIISDARVQYILGKMDANGYTAAIQKWKNAGGQSIIDKLNKSGKSGK